MYMFASLLGLIVVVGSYGTAAENTIHSYDFNPETGVMTPIDSLSGVSNSSFLAVADEGQTLLAVNENTGNDAALTLLRRDNAPGVYRPVAVRGLGGDHPCHVVVSPDGKYVVTSNYTGGSISVLGFDGDNGMLEEPTVVQFHGCGADTVRQATAHAHFTSFTPDGKFMITDDLGTDRLHIFPVGGDGRPELDSMSDVILDAGSGPRHLVFAADGVNAYLLNELDGNIVHLVYDSEAGTITPKQKILADYEHGRGSAHILLSHDGRHLYASNRLKGDGIAIFDVNPEDGSLTASGFVATGIHPRHFAITPDGHWMLVGCRDSNCVEVYRLDAATGNLTLTSSVSVPKPVCIVFPD